MEVKCIARLRQLGVGLGLYAQDHNNSIPPRVYAEEFTPTGEPKLTHWYRRLGRGGYLGAVTKNGDADCTFCPAYRPTGLNDHSLGNPPSADNRFGLRNWVPHGASWDFTDNTRLIPLVGLENPADFFLVADSYLVNDDAQGYMITQGSPSWRVHLRHNGKAHLLFADWHVEAKGREYFEYLHLRQRIGGGSDGRPFYLWPEISQK